MSRSRLLSGRVPKKSGSDLDQSRFQFLDLANAEPDLGRPNFDGAMLISNADGSRFWTDNIRIDLTGNIYVGTISNADGSSAISILDDMVAEKNLTVQGIFSAPDIITQIIQTLDSSSLKIESNTIIEGNLTVNGVVIGEITGATTGNIIGDILSDDGVKILENGTDGTDASFTGSVTGNIFTNQISSPDSSAITITPAVIFSSDLTVENTLFSDNLTSNSIKVDGDAVITGNLTVQGTTTTINSTTLSVADKNIELAKGADSAVAADGAGITVSGPAVPPSILYSYSDDRWEFNKDLLSSGTIFANRILIFDPDSGDFEDPVSGVDVRDIFQDLIDEGIDTSDSTPVRIVPSVVIESDLRVENELTVTNSVTAQIFVGYLDGVAKDIDAGAVRDKQLVEEVGPEDEILFYSSEFQMLKKTSLANITAIGANGFTGSQGESGYAGSAGADGYTGSQGDIGYTGSKGDPGTSITIVGSVDDPSLLPFAYNGNIGDGYITRNDGHLYIWNGTGWDDVGQIRGYTGSQGDIGYTGSQGDTGFVGSQGDTGFVGSQGVPGASVRLLGSVNTVQDLPISPDIGDGYLVLDAGDLYIWNGSQWTNVGKITGETGPIGYTGSQGEVGFVGSQGEVGFVGSQGDLGYTGSQGFTGSQGAVGPAVRILGSVETVEDLLPNGSVDGSTFVEIGDGYIVQANGVLYIWGGSEWTDVGQIVGDVGPTGFTGSIGFTGSVGFTGSQGESSFTWGPTPPENPTVGDRWYDTTELLMLVYLDDGDSLQWVEVNATGFLGAQGEIGYTGSVFAGTVQLFDDTVDGNLIIPSGKNGLTVGNISLATGATITIAAGQRWVII